jgi:hypothetical protein
LQPLPQGNLWVQGQRFLSQRLQEFDSRVLICLVELSKAFCHRAGLATVACDGIAERQ